MKIIITMAGEGSRFKRIGIEKSKYEIIAKDKTLFEWSMLSLVDFFSEEFIFIVKKMDASYNFIKEKCKELGIRKFKLLEIEHRTEGQASTVMEAESLISLNDGIAIYNIDTYIKEYSLKLEDISKDDYGFIPVFETNGESKWSFTRLDENNYVTEITEKVPISIYGTIGFYYFKNFSDFKKIYESKKEEIKEKYKETYIAPMYSYLINENKKIKAKILKSDEFIVLGTPEDIVEFDKDYLNKNM